MENKIIVDCSAFTSKEQLHRTMKEKLNNNGYIGNSLDALYDVLCSISSPVDITFINTSTANTALGKYFDRFIKVILNASDGNSNLNVTFSY